MRTLTTVMTSAACLLLAACQREQAPQASPSSAAVPSIAASLQTAVTFRHAASDAAFWIDASDAARSLILVSGGEGGLEMNDLSGARLARFESLEAGFLDVRQNVPVGDSALDLVIASDQRLGALHIYRLDAGARQVHPITASPIAVGDAVTGLCTYASALSGKLYAFVATDQGQLEQWELFIAEDKAQGRFVRRIAAGKGVSHCVADDATGTMYFSEESVGIWRIAAEPESDAARAPVDLVEPRGSLHEEVKGIALYRREGSAPYLIAADAGSGTLNVYSLAGERAGSFRIDGNGIEVGDAEGVTATSKALGSSFPDGAVIVADEDAGNYKLVSWGEISRSLSLPALASVAASSAQAAARTVKPAVETVPADSYGDAADDPAIWVDPKDLSRSVIIGTDKKLGLNVYDLDGKRLQVVADGRMNNVDLRDGFMLSGKPTTIVAATNRTTKSISVYRFDSPTRRLTSIADGTLESGLEDPYGLCMYRSAKSGQVFVFANDSVDGKLRQWQVIDRGDKVGLTLVRDLVVGSQAEGCVADDELGNLFVAEEDVGLWKYSAEPSGGETRSMVDKVDGGHLTADAEGVAIYHGSDGKGFIVLSNQGEDNYAVYRREGANEFVGKFHIIANESAGIDGASETDGLDVVSAPLGGRFPVGLLVVQDGRNLMPAERQNFKYVSWQDVMRALE